MENLNEEQCAICNDSLAVPENTNDGDKGGLVSTPCDHTFHGKCLLKWLEKGHPGNNCPICQAELQKAIFSREIRSALGLPPAPRVVHKARYDPATGHFVRIVDNETAGTAEQSNLSPDTGLRSGTRQIVQFMAESLRQPPQTEEQQPLPNADARVTESRNGRLPIRQNRGPVAAHRAIYDPATGHFIRVRENAAAREPENANGE